MSSSLQTIIDQAWEQRASLSAGAAPKETLDAVAQVLSELNNGRLRVATRASVGQWTVHQWIKKAVLLSFRLSDNAVIEAGALRFYDKVQPKFSHLDEQGMKAAGVRQDMDFINRQIGMFSYSGLSRAQMLRLRNEFGVYGTDTGRMCVAALNPQNLAHVCQAIAQVLEGG
ncbi:aminotransferase class I/II-fold pyridoxal phosphate-dependent enzyme [Verminephrobacter sp. Larva24]|nr:aminotransferase class I/II-fold pyridoxal phosphate-dependent enzyme [Verminephrobacter sp. Larva24]